MTAKFLAPVAFAAALFAFAAPATARTDAPGTGPATQAQESSMIGTGASEYCICRRHYVRYRWVRPYVRYYRVHYRHVRYVRIRYL